MPFPVSGANLSLLPSCPEIPDKLIDCCVGRRRFNRCRARFNLRKPVLCLTHLAK
jgi:hypothetical protein